MVTIVSRAQWGATVPKSRETVPKGDRRAVVIHYDDATPITVPTDCRTGCATQIRGTQRFHMQDRGWADIGYNFWICQHGTIWEGRGWDVLGAHAGAPGNRPGIGVQIHIGGNQEPSAAALGAARALYDEACRRFGRAMEKRRHSDYLSTSCPGPKLSAWVAAGMPTTNAPLPEEDDMPYTAEEITQMVQTGVERALWAAINPKAAEPLMHGSWRNFAEVLTARISYLMSGISTLLQSSGSSVDEAALAKAVVTGLGPVIADAVKEAGGSDEIAAAVVAKLGAAITEGAQA